MSDWLEAAWSAASFSPAPEKQSSREGTSRRGSNEAARLPARAYFPSSTVRSCPPLTCVYLATACARDRTCSFSYIRRT